MLFKSKKVLVTGHEGFLGKNLIKKLKKIDVDILTLTEPNGKKIDVRDWEKIKEIEKPDIIYHLAAVTYIPFAYKNPRIVYEVNVLGTLNILELARISNAEKFIFISSYVYGIPQYLPVDEEHPLNPNNPYSKSKLIAESLCRSYYHDFDLNCTILRPFNIYGSGQREDFLIPTIINQVKKGKINLKDPKPKRDFIHVDDVVTALIDIANKNYEFEIFNIGSGKSYSVKEIVDKIVSFQDKDLEVFYEIKRRKNEIDETVANIDKIQRKLGWKPKINIDIGLLSLYDVINK